MLPSCLKPFDHFPMLLGYSSNFLTWLARLHVAWGRLPHQHSYPSFFLELFTLQPHKSFLCSSRAPSFLICDAPYTQSTLWCNPPTRLPPCHVIWLIATHLSGLSVAVIAKEGLPLATQDASLPYSPPAKHSVFFLYSTYDYCNLIIKCVIIECLFFTPHLLTPDYKVHGDGLCICSVHYFIKGALPTSFHLVSNPVR